MRKHRETITQLCDIVHIRKVKNNFPQLLIPSGRYYEFELVILIKKFKIPEVRKLTVNGQ